MNNDINEKIVHAAPVPPFVRFVASAVPMVFDNSLSYYEALCALWKWMQDNLVDVINHNASVTEQYIDYDLHTRELFIELKSYVDNYFDNLDVQEEINNKLDEMAESGQLTDIIAQYLGLAGMIVFDTVSDMKSAENLVNGSKCYTLGYHSVNDGGSAVYKVRTLLNTDNVNEMNLIALHDITLVAELNIADDVNVKQLGAKGDGTTDNTSVLTYAINNYNSVYIPSGNYLITDELPLNTNNYIHGDGFSSTIKFNYTYSDTIKYAFKASGTIYHTVIDNINIYTSNVNSLTGGIKVDSATRGNEIKNLWFNSISNPIYLGDEIWAIFNLENIFAYYFPDSQDVALREYTVGIHCDSCNTVMAKNIEVIGSYHYGVYLNDTKVSSFTETNISGSSTFKMDTAFRLDDCYNINIDTSWHELIEGNTHNAETIYVKDSQFVSLTNLNVANGSIWLDGSSDITLKNNRFTTANGGLRYTNNCKRINSDTPSLGYCNYQGNYLYVGGEINVTDLNNTSNANIKTNPFMLNGLSTDIVVSNSNVTVTNNTESFVTGDRSRNFNSPDYQGCQINTSNVLENGRTYTAIALVKPVSNVKGIYFQITGGTSVNNFPNGTVVGSSDEFVKIRLCFTVNDSTSSLKIGCRLTDSGSNGDFLVDSIYIYEGYHDYSLPAMDKRGILATEKVYSDYVPYAGTWRKGDVIYNSFSNVANDAIQSWVYNGTTWKVNSMPA